MASWALNMPSDIDTADREGNERSVIPARARFAGYVRNQKGIDGRVAQYGFGSLPLHLLKTILTLAMDDIELTPDEAGTITGLSNGDILCGKEGLLVLRKKAWLEQMRRVCRAWRDAADAQPLWGVFAKRFTRPQPSDASNPFRAARGGVVRGLDTRFVKLPAYVAYVVRGEGNARTQASRAVDELFLSVHTEYDSALGDFRDLQILYHELREELVFRDLDPAERLRLTDILDAIHGPSNYNINWAVRDITNYARGRGLWFNSDYELQVEDAEPSSDPEVVRQTQFGASFRSKLIDNVLELWVAERVRNGWWVAPEDEVKQLVAIDQAHAAGRAAPFIHTPFESFWRHRAAIGPPDAKPHATRHMALREGAGLLHVQSAVARGMSDLPAILPPAPILERMSLKYRQALSGAIGEALDNVVVHYRAVLSGGKLNQAAYDAAAQACARQGMKEVMGWLVQDRTWQFATLEEIGLADWTCAARARQAQLGQVEQHAAAAVVPKASMPEAQTRSPIIELVTDEKAVDLDYGITVIRDDQALDSDDKDDVDTLDGDTESMESEDADAAPSSPPLTAALPTVLEHASTAASLCPTPRSHASSIDRKRKDSGDDEREHEVGRETKRERSDPAVDNPTIDSFPMHARVPSADSHGSNDSVISAASSSVAPATPVDSPGLGDVAVRVVLDEQVAAGFGGWVRQTADDAGTGEAAEKCVDKAIEIAPCESKASQPATSTAAIAVKDGFGSSAHGTSGRSAPADGAGLTATPASPSVNGDKDPHIQQARRIVLRTTQPAPGQAQITPAPMPPAASTPALLASTKSSSSLSSNSDDALDIAADDVEYIFEDETRLPFVPPASAELGPGTREVVMAEWKRACGELDVCFCCVCRRDSRGNL
ncbi:hypothetical protein Q5752_004420 [Cryptotrichosporon argae]